MAISDYYPANHVTIWYMTTFHPYCSHPGTTLDYHSSDNPLASSPAAPIHNSPTTTNPTVTTLPPLQTVQPTIVHMNPLYITTPK
jgi:hypothetical protein